MTGFSGRKAKAAESPEDRCEMNICGMKRNVHADRACSVHDVTFPQSYSNTLIQKMELSLPYLNSKMNAKNTLEQGYI